MVVGLGCFYVPAPLCIVHFLDPALKYYDNCMYILFMSKINLRIQTLYNTILDIIIQRMMHLSYFKITITRGSWHGGNCVFRVWYILYYVPS